MNRTPLLRKTPLRSRSRLRAVGARGKRLAPLDAQMRVSTHNRWNGICVRCSRKPAKGDTHHIFGKQAFPHLRHVQANCVYLCRPCHEWAHHDPAASAMFFISKLTPAEFSELAERYTTQGL